MANLKNWMPPMMEAEHRWFDACPKAVLFEIARQFAVRINGEQSAETAFALMAQEWKILHENGIVPQKPLNPSAVGKRRSNNGDSTKLEMLYWARDVKGDTRREEIFRRKYGMTADEALAAQT